MPRRLPFCSARSWRGVSPGRGYDETHLGVSEDLATPIGAELIDLGRLEEGDHLPERVIRVVDDVGGHELAELLVDEAVLVRDARDDLREDVQPLRRSAEAEQFRSTHVRRRQGVDDRLDRPMRLLEPLDLLEVRRGQTEAARWLPAMTVSAHCAASPTHSRRSVVDELADEAITSPWAPMSSQMVSRRGRAW